jgi:hypothetical protein
LLITVALGAKSCANPTVPQNTAAKMRRFHTRALAKDFTSSANASENVIRKF